MELRTQIKAIDFMKKMIKGELNTSGDLIPEYEKKLQSESNGTVPLRRGTPESVGFSSKYLISFLQELSQCKKEHLHGICITTKGNVILEQGFAPYTIYNWHISHSLCKSITALAIGKLITDGKLAMEDTIVEIFKQKKPSFVGKRMKKITVRHLLSMSSGIQFAELESLFEKDWVKGCLNANVAFEPGSKFEYNSLNTYLLSAIVVEKTKKGLLKYLQEEILLELGIGDLFWEKCPLGIEKGGWGLSLTIEDMTKFGILYLNKGNWNGKQLISREYIEEAIKKQIDTPDSVSLYGYGYHIWMCPKNEAYQFNGMFGQNVFIFPNIDTVIVTTAGSENFFPKNAVFDVVMKYFLGSKEEVQKKMKAKQLKEIGKELYKKRKSEIDTFFLEKLMQYGSLLEYNKIPKIETTFLELPKHLLDDEIINSKVEQSAQSEKETISRRIRNWWQQKKMIQYEKQKIDMEKWMKSKEYEHLDKKKEELFEETKSVMNKIYDLEEQQQGILPLCLQMMHQTYTEGIKTIALREGEDTQYQEKQLELIVQEGEVEKKILVGIGQALYGTYEIAKQMYKIGTIGEWHKNEDDILVLKITICFIETSHTRILYLYFNENEIKVRLREEPDLGELIKGGLSLLTGEQKDRMLKLATTLQDLDYTKYLIQKITEPTIQGREREK